MTVLHEVFCILLYYGYYYSLCYICVKLSCSGHLEKYLLPNKKG